MHFLDWFVIGSYAAAMLAIGRYYATRANTSDDYLLGGRKMSPFRIGLSVFAPNPSQSSYLASPG